MGVVIRRAGITSPRLASGRTNAMDVKQLPCEIRSLLDRTGPKWPSGVAARSRLAVWQRVAGRRGESGPSRGPRLHPCPGRCRWCKEETSRLIEQEGAKWPRIRERIEAAATASLIETIVSQIAPPRQRRMPPGRLIGCTVAAPADRAIRLPVKRVLVDRRPGRL